MPLSLLLRSLSALALSAVATGAAAQETVTFASLDGRTNLTAYLSCPEGDAPSAKARGNPIELKSYPSAAHAFDAPNLPRTELPAYRAGDGPIPVIATDREARADAFVRVLAFLKSRLETN
jgi:hypothetical protein